MIITVPADCSPLLVIADVEGIKDARIFIGTDVVKTLQRTAYNEYNCYEDKDVFQLNYEVIGNEYFDHLDSISVSDTPSCRTWYKVREFEFRDIHYCVPRNPKFILHVKMA